MIDSLWHFYFLSLSVKQVWPPPNNLHKAWRMGYFKMNFSQIWRRCCHLSSAVNNNRWCQHWFKMGNASADWAESSFFYFLTIGVLLFVCWMKSLGWYEERCIPQVLPHDIKQETYKRNSSKPRTPISWKFCHIFYLLLGIISFKTNSSD